MELPYHRTPVQEVHHPVLSAAGVRLLIKREDMNHPFVTGNKWWKLKYNLQAAVRERQQTILTFGGAYSNHIYATAAAAEECGLGSIGIIRGEETFPLNTTLAFAKQRGMRIKYVGRSVYRDKYREEYIRQLYDEFGPIFLIPEGGSNLLAVKGCAEFAEKELLKINFDHLVVATGTGGTLAGLICGLKGKGNIIGISVIKGEGSLSSEVEKMSHEFIGQSFNNWSIRTEYHHGGYAKITKELRAFIDETEIACKLPLDPVYTAKAFWAVVKLAAEGFFKRGDTVLFLHTGGLQGRAGFVVS